MAASGLSRLDDQHLRVSELPAQLTSGAPANVGAERDRRGRHGSTYADILTRGYHFYEYGHDCPELPAGSECLFANYQAE
jgi:hypothetical protein